LKGLGSAIAGGILGSLILIFTVGFVDWWLTSRQTLEPGEKAIIREVWKKEGPLWGPSPPPYQVRVVKNNSSRQITFFIQPYPFGYVEEIIKEGEVKEFSFDLPLWTKDTITHNPDDASIARVLSGEGEFQIKDIRLYAENLDYRGLPYAKQGDLLYPVKAFLIRRGREPEVSSREELLSEIVYMGFSQFFSTTVNKWGESIAQKYTLLAKSIREREIISIKEREEFIADFLKKYPWYKLEPDSLEKLRGNVEVQELFQKYFEALRAENLQLANSSLREIEEFFSRYIEKNPEAYDEEKWDYVKSLLLHSDTFPSEYKLEFIYPFVEERIQDIREEYTKTMQQEISTSYGVEILKFQVEMKEDLTARHPYILMQR